MATTKVKGVRANKPNDSFGVINNKNLYRNKYREDVYKDDEEQPEETQDPTPRSGYSRRKQHLLTIVL